MALFPLGITVEILVNGVWTDVSAYVMQRDLIQITGGRTARSDTAQPAQVTLTFRNGDGRFSPNNASGPYWPYLKRNVQLRVSISDTSSSGNVYSGFRGWFEVAAWPPQSDISGSDVFVQVTASGPLRRIRKGGGKGSALTRYYASLTGGLAPVAYWPCEEDPDTTIIGAGIDGGTDMAVTAGTPKWKASSGFNGSAPVGVLDNSTWDGLTGQYSTSGDDVFAAPGTYTWISPVSSVNAIVTGGGGGGAQGPGPGTGAAGGGGERAQETALAVTPGQPYTIVVGAGGTGGAGDYTGLHTGSAGASSSIAGDAVTVTAHGGQGGSLSAGGAGGTGSTNTVTHPGGAGGKQTGGNAGGGGGGGSGGTSATGNAGASTSSNTHGAGAAAVTGGGHGGDGGDGGFGSPPASGGVAGGIPGGGGGAGGTNLQSGFLRAGGNGASGRVELVYTPAATPSNNVVRFLMQTPSWGGNQGKVLLRVLTSGTVGCLEVQFSSTARKLVLKGFATVGGSLLFTGNLSTDIASGGTSPNLGPPWMVSAELSKSGANVGWRLAIVQPGGTADFDSVSGTQTTATMGNVTEVIAGPNADITKTAVGHISVQYAFQGLTKVSNALGGHNGEMGIDRFVRLATEQLLVGSAVEFNETADHWGFETGTQSWTGNNASVAQSSTAVTGWPSFGTKSLKVTASGGAGLWSADGPSGTSGQPVNPQDVVSAACDIYTPASLGALRITVRFYDVSGTFLSSVSGFSTSTGAGTIMTLTVGAGEGCIAPSGAAFFNVRVADNETVTAGTIFYVDHVRVHPQMGVQTRKEYHQFLEEIEDLDQGIMKEAKELWGLKFRTRIRMINQAVAATLAYGMLSPPLQPVLDDKFTKNDITVVRHKGSKVRVTLSSGTMSVLEPPAGTGRYRKRLKAVAKADEQLLALAAHLLALGTVSDERYPQIHVNMARCGITGNALAPLMSAIASVEIGDRIQVTGLPSWMPSSSIDQMVIGYSETIGPYTWQISWNCIPYSPFVQATTSLRRW